MAIISAEIQSRLEKLVPAGGFGRGTLGRGAFVDAAISKYLDELGDQEIPRIECGPKTSTPIISPKTHLRMRLTSVERNIPSSNIAIVAVGRALDLLEAELLEEQPGDEQDGTDADGIGGISAEDVQAWD